MTLPWGTFWPSCTVLSFKAVDTSSVDVRVSVRVAGFLWWGRTREETWRLVHRGGGWFWADTGVELSHAQSFVWAGLHNAIGHVR